MAAAIETGTVARGNLATTVSATGSAIARKQAKLAFGVGGKLTELDVVNGQSAKANDVIAKLDDTGQQRTVATAQASLTEAQNKLDQLLNPPPANLADAEASVASAQSALTSAKNSLISSRGSFISAVQAYCDVYGLFNVCAQGTTPLSDSQASDLISSIGPGLSWAAKTSATLSLLQANGAYVNAQLAEGNAEANLSLAQSKLDALKNPAAADVQSAKDVVQQAQFAYDQARSDLDHFTLIAPFDGVVGGLAIAEGDLVGASDVLVTLFDPSAISVDLSIGEIDLPSVKVGTYATVTFDAIPEHAFVAKITSIDPTPVASQGVVSFTARADILTGQDAQDAVGQFASALGGNRGFNRQGSGGQFPGNQGTPSPGQTPGAGGFGFDPAASAPAGTGGDGGFAAMITPPAMPNPGMNATATLITNTYTDLLLVPTGAVRRVGRDQVVFVMSPDGETAEQHTVTVGVSDGTVTEILSGVDEGATIVTNPAALFSDQSATPTATVPAGGQRFGGGGFGPGDGGGVNGIR